MAGIYIHIPFCSQYCTYCNFYSVKQLGLRDKFVGALCNEVFARRDFFNAATGGRNFARGELSGDKGSSVTTLYIGGGTPSVLSLEQLAAVVGAVKESFGLVLPESGVYDAPQSVSHDGLGDASHSASRDKLSDKSLHAAGIAYTNKIEEFTIEVNPNDVTPEYAAGLVALGVNRVSMGVQSFKDEHLAWMNRRHNAAEGKRAVGILREAGISNISIDLIFGYAMLSEEDWEHNIREAISLKPQHISAYQMSIEPGSALGAMYKRGEYAGLSDEECEAQYRRLQSLLAEAGYDQYEISNFALHSEDGRYRSKHNSSYWEGVPYLGLGPAAHSYTGILASEECVSAACEYGGGCGSGPSDTTVQARRIWNNPSVKGYCDYYNGSTNGRRSIEQGGEVKCKNVSGDEELTATDIFNETIMLGLRKCAGFSLELLDAALLGHIESDIARLARRGLLVREGNNIRIPSDKLFVSDSIIRELFL